MSSAPLTSPAVALTSSGSSPPEASKNPSDASSQSFYAKSTATSVKLLSASGILDWIKSPVVWSTVFALSFLATFVSVCITSGVNSLTAHSAPTLQVWWVGTLLSSILTLLLFYIVYHSSANLNRGMIIIIFCTLIITHVSLLLTQINLRVT